MLIDLQLHSTYSDGNLTPTELVKFMAEYGIKIASLTDHNTVGGVQEFREACKKYKIKPITGVEFYVKYKNHRFNMLWYNFDAKNPELHKLFRDSQIRRKKQVRRVLEKFLKMGFVIDVEKILDKYTHYVPLNGIIRDIRSVPANLTKMKKECECQTPTESEIIKHYFRNPRVSVLQESYISLERILKHKKQIGGQLILNHPGKHRFVDEKLMGKLKKMGVDGVELLSPHHSYGAIIHIQHLARSFDFIETGGSDFHRSEDENYLLEKSWDYFRIDSELLRGVKKIIG